MLFEASERREWREFLEMAAPCRTFVDIGASGGFFSTLFAASKAGSGQGGTVLSIEPDPACGPILGEMRDLHGEPGLKWIIEPCALGAEPGTMSFASSGFGGELISNIRDNRGQMEELASTNGLAAQMTSVEVTTLDRICERHGLVPDLVSARPGTSGETEP